MCKQITVVSSRDGLSHATHGRTSKLVTLRRELTPRSKQLLPNNLLKLTDSDTTPRKLKNF
eukprot:UN25603